MYGGFQIRIVGNLQNHVQLIDIQYLAIIRGGHYAEPLSALIALCLRIDVGHSDNIGLVRRQILILEKIDELAAECTASDDGHIGPAQFPGD